MECVGRNCFYPNFAMVVHPKTCPCLLQLIVLLLPLFSFLQLLKPVFLPFPVPRVHSPSVILHALSSQFSSIFPYLSFAQIPSSSLSVPSLHHLASILSFSFSCLSLVSPGSRFSVRLLNVCVVSVKSLFNTNSTCALGFFVQQ